MSREPDVSSAGVTALMQIIADDQHIYHLVGGGSGTVSRDGPFATIARQALAARTTPTSDPDALDARTVDEWREEVERAFRAGHEHGFDAADNTSRSQQSTEDEDWNEYYAAVRALIPSDTAKGGEE